MRTDLISGNAGFIGLFEKLTAYCDSILTCLLSASVGNAVSRVARALAVSILKSNQSTLAGRWRCVAGAFDGSGSVHPLLMMRRAGGHRGATAG
jgi:hypothetical protein